jgi:hypothetical protein
MKKLFPIAAALAFMLGAGPSWADIDYACVNTCAGTGKAPTACLAKCTTQDQPSDQSMNQPINPAAPQTRTDYRCVDLCVHGGKPASSCMSLCAYSVTSPPLTPDKTLSAHDVLKAPTPAGDAILPSPDKTSKPESGKNYKCIQQCLRDGMQYQLCNTNCASVTPEYETNGQ